MRPAWDVPRHRPPLEINPELIAVFGFTALLAVLSYIGVHAFHLSGRQMTEIDGYVVLLAMSGFFACWHPATARSRREKQWPHPPLVVKPGG